MNNTTIDQNKTQIPFIPFIFLIIAMSFIFLRQFNQSDKFASKTGAPSGAEYPKEGFIAPNFTLPLMGTNKKATLSDYRGKIIFINFWATWCPTCDEEMESMEKLYQKFKEKGFDMLTINIDKTKKDVEEYIKKNKLTFSVLLDPKNLTGKDYQTTGVPETFILDRDGTILSKVIGPRDWASEDANAVFKKLIEG